MAAGVYRIRNIVNGKRYIGSSTNLSARLRKHRAALRRGDHDNEILQRAWAKYGEAAFVFEIIVFCQEHDLLRQEQALLDQHPEYNILRHASSRLGSKHTPEARARMSTARRGQPCPLSPQARADLGVRNRRRVWSEEMRERVGKAQRGRMLDPESVARRADAQRGAKREGDALENLRRGALEKAKAVEAVDRHGLVVHEFVSISAASQYGFERSCIFAVLRGKSNTHRDLFWRYADG